MYLEVTSVLPPDAAAHYEAIRTVLFARTPRWGRRVKMVQGRGGAEITIKGLCSGPTAELLGVLGESLGCPRGPVALDPLPLI